jgi:NAD(P)-dependent dehydrogenase (short-subunit alcohol dehydrogenase family)
VDEGSGLFLAHGVLQTYYPRSSIIVINRCDELLPVVARLTTYSRTHKAVDMKLDGQVAIITGASGGLGRAVALALAEEGAALVLAARSGQALNDLATQIEGLGREALVVRCDVREPQQVDDVITRTLAEWNRIDVLVNSAGVALRRPATEIDAAAWDEVVDTLLKGTFLMTRAVLPTMIAAKRGNVINLHAPLDKIAVPGFSAYTAAKWGVEGLTKTLGKELRRYSININGVHPGGFADTAMVRENVPELKGGLLDPSVITPAVVALATQPPRGLTGTTIDAQAWNTDEGLGGGLQ